MKDLSLIKQRPLAVGTLNHCYPPSQERFPRHVQVHRHRPLVTDERLMAG